MKKRKYTRSSLRKKKYEQSKKVDELRKSWNPLPVRGATLPRLSSTIEKKSNFINCKQKYMNVGKYKGIDIIRVPLNYLIWVSKNIELNETELTLLRKTISLLK